MDQCTVLSGDLSSPVVPQRPRDGHASLPERSQAAACLECPRHRDLVGIFEIAPYRETEPEP